MIVIDNVTKTFRGNFRPTIDGLSLSMNPGEFCVVIGPNGCGKSTLLKLISGEVKPDSGAIRCQDNVTKVAQDTNLVTLQDMTLLENIALSMITKYGGKFAFYKRYKNEILAKLKELNIGVEKYLDHPFSNLSGGQQQMVATLMAMISGRKILLLDEHTSALDPKMGILLMKYTAKQIKKMKLTSIMVTHKMDDAIKYGTRLVMIHRGKIIMDVRDSEKQKLKVQDLLALFHQYEDQTLLSENTI